MRLDKERRELRAAGGAEADGESENMPRTTGGATTRNLGDKIADFNSSLNPEAPTGKGA